MKRRLFYLALFSLDLYGLGWNIGTGIAPWWVNFLLFVGAGLLLPYLIITDEEARSAVNEPGSPERRL